MLKSMLNDTFLYPASDRLAAEPSAKRIQFWVMINMHFHMDLRSETVSYRVMRNWKITDEMWYTCERNYAHVLTSPLIKHTKAEWRT